MNDFAVLLKNEIQTGLPGTEVQWQMASSDRFVRNFPRIPGNDARIAGVLIPLFPEKGSIHTIFMQRPEYNGVHGGQISFPGGKKEPEDVDVIQTALREAYEEIGVERSTVEVIGTLTPLFIPVSNMIVTPVLGWINEKPDFKCQHEEVVFLINAELRNFLNPLIIKSKPFEIRGEMLNVKYFDYNNNTIWGATAMILYELLAIIKRASIPLDMKE
jgi:8-oxo-dGTP pyrophosphatase MutT (NUDIX family)